MKIVDDFEKVLSVIESCESYAQLNTAKKMLCCFFEKYKNEFDSITKAHTMEKVQKSINYTLLRIVK